MLDLNLNPEIKVWTILFKPGTVSGRVYIWHIFLVFADSGEMKCSHYRGTSMQIAVMGGQQIPLNESHCESSVHKKQTPLAFFYRSEINLIEWGLPGHCLITFSTLFLRRKQQIDFCGVSRGAHWTKVHRLCSWGKATVRVLLHRISKHLSPGGHFENSDHGRCPTTSEREKKKI